MQQGPARWHREQGKASRIGGLDRLDVSQSPAQGVRAPSQQTGRERRQKAKCRTNSEKAEEGWGAEGSRCGDTPRLQQLCDDHADHHGGRDFFSSLLSPSALPGLLAHGSLMRIKERYSLLGLPV